MTSIAEEKGSGKIKLIKRGAYKSMDACLMYVCIYTRTSRLASLTLYLLGRLHPSAGPVPRAHVGSTLAVQQVTVEFHGKTYGDSLTPSLRYAFNSI